jgi:hypothetical protein
MSLHLLSQIAFWSAVIPAALFCWNLFYFRRPPKVAAAANRPAISVLIPARNEEKNIGAAVASVLASGNIDFELIVLDDASTDRTAEIVHTVAAADARVRCIPAPKLKPGWAGKAHAAQALSTHARYDIFCFIDADVRIAPDTLARMHALLVKTNSALVSGFPEEITVTPLEWLLLPLIQFLLLCYLPFAALRHTNLAGFGAGCGQFLMMTRPGYEKTGGYASVPTTMHDGIVLSKLFRRHGLHTEVADLTGLAACRMYSSSSDVWQGLTKNATEGIAAPARIVPFTLLLFCGQILPWLLLLYAIVASDYADLRALTTACAASLLPRLISIARFRQRTIGALLHPLGVCILLVLQWSALLRKLRGTPATWKGRAFNVG